MIKFRIIMLAVLVSNAANTFGGYQFRVYLKDKDRTEYSIEKPEEYLSNESLERRKKQQIEITESDKPISDEYIRTIKRLNIAIIAKSKWMNTLTIECKDSTEVDNLKGLPFVEKTIWIGKSDHAKQINAKSPVASDYPPQKAKNYYGHAMNQIYSVNGHKLHEKGYWGKGIKIAVIDAGFSGLKDNLYLSDAHISGIKDFVNDDTDILNASQHGISVLSVMATNQPYTFVGTAPKAEYWLFRSEYIQSEYPVEEDYWVSAIEFADSIGIDIVNTSLGYFEFDAPEMNYTLDKMDGKTSFMSKAAQTASEKGILVVVSVGNEGNTLWEKITIPADANNVLSVGSMSKDSIVSKFSSAGPTFDGRIKPDVLAVGEKINLLNSKSEIIIGNGTSFAAPIITGLAACLWEAYPSLTCRQIIDIICESSNMYNEPGRKFGYGIPNMEHAMTLAEKISPIAENK